MNIKSQLLQDAGGSSENCCRPSAAQRAAVAAAIAAEHAAKAAAHTVKQNIVALVASEHAPNL